MPLALELAAGWVNVLPLAEIARGVAESLDALTSNAHDLPDRHRNMRAVFDLTWQRMTEAEQQLFARLSIFRGGFTRAAAEEIADASMQHWHYWSTSRFCAMTRPSIGIACTNCCDNLDRSS